MGAPDPARPTARHLRDGSTLSVEPPSGRPLALTVYGSATCEDTAITRSRLHALGVPFRDVDIDAAPDGLDHVLALNGGRRVTPTLVVEGDDLVAAEPSIERVDGLVARAGYPIVPPRAVQFHAPRTGRPVPFLSVPTARGERFSLAEWRGRRQAVLFFAHPATCLACLGYATQLARQAEALAEADARPLVVVAGEAAEAADWRSELPPAVTLLADPAGAWRRRVAGDLGAAPDDVLLLVLDRYCAPRAGSVAGEAGGLLGPGEATEWSRFVTLDCPECGGEVPWPA